MGGQGCYQTRSMRRRFWTVVALCAVLATGGACGGAPKGLGDGGVYRDGPVAFRVAAPPSGWRRIDVTVIDVIRRGWGPPRSSPA